MKPTWKNLKQKKLHKYHPLLPRNSLPCTYYASATLTKKDTAHNNVPHDRAWAA